MRAADKTAQRSALDKFRDDVVAPVLPAKVVDGDDIGMVERAHQSGFTLEPANSLWIVDDTRRQEFERRPPTEPRVESEIDRPHTAAPQLFDQAINADHFAAVTLRIITAGT